MLLMIRIGSQAIEKLFYQKCLKSCDKTRKIVCFFLQKNHTRSIVSQQYLYEFNIQCTIDLLQDAVLPPPLNRKVSQNPIWIFLQNEWLQLFSVFFFYKKHYNLIDRFHRHNVIRLLFESYFQNFGHLKRTKKSKRIKNNSIIYD